MKLDNNFSISKIPENWVLNYVGEKITKTYIEKKTKQQKEKEVTPKNQWYYPSLETALKGYIDKSLGQCDFELLSDVFVEIEKINNKIDAFIQSQKLNK